MLQFYDFILWLLFWFQLRIDHVLAGFYHHKFPNRRTLGDTSSHFFVAIKTGYFLREVAQSPSEIVASKTGIFNLNRDVFTNTNSCFFAPNPEHSTVIFNRFGLRTFGNNNFLRLPLWRLNVRKQDHHVCCSLSLSECLPLTAPQWKMNRTTALHETSSRSQTAMMCWEEIWSERYIIFPWEDFELKSRTGGQQFNVSVKWHENRTSWFVETKQLSR